MSPLAAWALAGTLALAVARAWSPTSTLSLWPFALALAPAALLVRRDRLRLLLLVVLLASRGAADGVRLRPPPSGSLTDETELWMRGRVVSGPDPARGGTRITLEVESAALPLPRAGVSLWADSSAGVPRRGSRVLVHAAVRRPRVSNTPGAFDEGGWLSGKGAVLTGRVTGAAWREVRAPAPSLDSFLRTLEMRWSRRLAARVPGEPGEFVRGLLLGERGNISPEAIRDLRRAGALHLLALSGQHVVLVAALLVGLLRFLRLPALGREVLATVGVWAYAVLTGSSPSVLRAATAVTLTAWARVLGRRISGVDALTWSAAIPAWVAPSLALDTGYQLSCLASAGLLLAARFDRALEAWRQAAGGALARIIGWGRRLLAPVTATAFAQLAVLPLLALRFGAVSIVGLASNLVLVPACAALLAAGLPLLVLDTLFPTPVGAWRVLSALSLLVLDSGSAFAAWPGAWIPCALTSVCAIASFAAGGLALWFWRCAERPLARFAPGLAMGLSLAGLGLCLGLWIAGFGAPRPAPVTTLRYWLLDVGQGDAQVLEFADGRVIVVDTGDAREGFDAGSDVLVPFLHARRIRAIDTLVLTHEDRDHAGGCASLLRDIPARELASGGECFEALDRREPMVARGPARRVVAAGDTLARGPGYQIRVLWPPAGRTGLPSNGRSVVLEVAVESERLLLTGDADTTSEAGWLPGVSQPIEVLKLGHHGSRSSTGERLLDLLRPDVGLVSCGRHNRFGHPHAETLARLARHGVRVVRTDRDGTIRLDLGAPAARRVRLTRPAKSVLVCDHPWWNPVRSGSACSPREKDPTSRPWPTRLAAESWAGRSRSC